LREAVKHPQIMAVSNREYYRFGKTQREIYADLEGIDYDLAVVGSFVTFWYLGSFEIIRSLKALYPDKPVFLGGIYATLCQEHAMAKSGADQVLSGQFDERVLAQILGALNYSPDKSYTPQEIAIDLEAVKDKPYLSFTQSIGCPYRCDYCASQILAPRQYEIGLPDLKVFEEFAKEGKKDIAFFDDAMLYHLPYVQKLIAQLEAKHLQFRYHTPNGLHIRMINPTVASYLYEKNFVSLRFGLENLDPVMQEKSGYKAGLKQVLDGIACLKKAGFTKNQIGFYLLVSPFGDKVKLAETIKLLKEQDVNLHLSLYSPVPLTKDYSMLVEKYPFIQEEPLYHNDSLFLQMAGLLDQDWVNAVRKEIRCYNGLNQDNKLLT
jgi:radical SAM superfamily enzyme YgiQ (UPF0313 family)